MGNDDLFACSWMPLLLMATRSSDLKKAVLAKNADP
jgi:hypothetical protein